MDGNWGDRHQILYEIAMSIGTSLDLRQMLKVSLSTMLKKLNCSAGGILVSKKDPDERVYFEKVFSIPRDLVRNETYEAALRQLAALTDAAELGNSSDKFPISGQPQAGRYFHVLELPGCGALILIKNGQDLDPLVPRSLRPLLTKLASACKACMQNEEAQKAHARLRQISDRNQAIVDAFPDSMFFLSRDVDVLALHLADKKDLPPWLSSEAIKGQNLRDMLPPDLVDSIARYVATALDSAEMQVFAYQLPTRQGVKFYEARLVASGPDEVLVIVRNVSRRKLAEEQIGILALFPAETPEPVLRVGQDGTLLYVNPAGQPLLDDWQRGVGQLVPSDWAVRIEETFTSGDNNTLKARWGDRTFSFLVSPLSEANYANLFGREISESEQAKESAAWSEARLRAIINTAPDGIITIDDQGIVEMVNPAAERMFGYAGKELVGNSVNMLMPSPYHEEHDSYLARYLSTGEAKIIGVGREAEGRRKDGTTFPLYLSVGEIQAGGHRRKFTGIVRDISELKKAEQMLSTVLDTVGEGIITFDRSGLIVMVNQEVVRIWGYKQQELIGQNLQMLIPKAAIAGPEWHLQTDEPYFLGRRTVREGQRQNGSIFPVEVHVTEAETGEQLLFTAAVRDITLRLEFDRMRDNFVSTVSHELRTPLASIMGWTDTLLAGRPGPLTDRQRQALETMQKSSGRLNSLVDEILTVARIRAGALKLQEQPFVPSEAVTNVQNMILSLTSAKAITLEIRNEWPSNEWLSGDQERLEQVITNLVSNAIKFTPQGGRVCIQSYQDHGSWHFEVTDTGIGIPEADRSRLFERFFRAGNASEEQFQGTGLGLYVCKAIIEGHGGQIGLESEVNVGTKAWFTINA